MHAVTEWPVATCMSFQTVGCYSSFRAAVKRQRILLACVGTGDRTVTRTGSPPMGAQQPLSSGYLEGARTIKRTCFAAATAELFVAPERGHFS
jgi:hypothetical protein